MKWADPKASNPVMGADEFRRVFETVDAATGMTPEYYIMSPGLYKMAHSPCHHGSPQMVNCSQCWKEYFDAALAAAGDTP